MDGMIFEWDEAKVLANQKKHGFSFVDAIEAFQDPLCLLIVDRVENGEVRWQTYGMVKAGLLMVVHMIRDVENDEIIRIISARSATKHERRRYEEQDG
jgi:uncharacterized protein